MNKVINSLFRCNCWNTKLYCPWNL